MNYKREEIQEHFNDYLTENEERLAVRNLDPYDVHHEAFNQDYYIIGTWKAEQWLGDQVFNIIGYIKEYEQDNFGEVYTDLTSPEAVVNMYTYIIGEQIVSDWYNTREA